jgi:hypothetical protein
MLIFTTQAQQLNAARISFSQDSTSVYLTVLIDDIKSVHAKVLAIQSSFPTYSSEA